MLGYTNESIYQLKLPGSMDKTVSLHIIVHIRDRFDCVTDFNLSLVTVSADLRLITQLIDNLQEENTDPIIELLANAADENSIGQIVTSISHLINQLDNQLMQSALTSKECYDKSIQ
jgi:hypothetical protein